ncbi:diguanylate cyclase [Phosphitispora sp. TUW77]|uniref:diguanylate cyclase n=1 Tax=Phosphitispora sp. TUW77 TaxID=3152361 RepID=UPI003AB2C604
MNSWFRGLNKQILALTLSVALGASFVLGLSALLVFYKQSRDQVLERNREIAGYISNEINIRMSRALDVSDYLAMDPAIRTMDPAIIQQELARLFSVINNFDGIILTDNKGETVAVVPETSKLIPNLSQRSWVKQVLLSGQQYISEPYLASNGNDLIVLATPIKDDIGRVIGIIGGSMDLKKTTKFSTIISSRLYNPKMDVQVIDKNGMLIYNSHKDLIMQKAKPSIVTEALLKGEGGSYALEISDQPYLIGYAPVEKLGWGVIVTYPSDSAFQSVVYLKNLIAAITLLLSIIVFCIAYRESKAITKPLQKLMEGVKRVAEGDYHFNVNVSSNNEIGVLADSFNAMVERIKDMREDILEKQEKLEKANIELKIMAITDGLTKLYNHRYFQDSLGKAISLARQEGKSVTLMILDIDSFKNYNDLFGHQAGDRLLEELGQLLIRELGPNDMVARYGGEEFTVILYDSDNDSGVLAAEKVRAAVEAFPFPGREQQPDGKVTISIGVASFPENAKSKEELVRLADEALYKAKCCSKNKVELYFSVLDDLKHDLNKSEAELINSIKMLVRIINAKDKYTYGHSERVGRYAVSIAEEMGLLLEEVKIIRMGAFLHDVGKIEISRSILMKKGPLSEEEFETIRQHPFWGAGIIKAVESLHPVIPLIKYHHERFDGSGYPLGLKGKQIPLHARILAVADSFDAMTTNRPYMKSKNLYEAIEELNQCSGKQFDPEIVDVFLDILQTEKVKVG